MCLHRYDWLAGNSTKQGLSLSFWTSTTFLLWLYLTSERFIQCMWYNCVSLPCARNCQLLQTPVSYCWCQFCSCPSALSLWSSCTSGHRRIVIFACLVLFICVCVVIILASPFLCRLPSLSSRTVVYKNRLPAYCFCFTITIISTLLLFDFAWGGDRWWLNPNIAKYSSPHRWLTSWHHQCPSSPLIFYFCSWPFVELCLSRPIKTTPP